MKSFVDIKYFLDKVIIIIKVPEQIAFALIKFDIFQVFIINVKTYLLTKVYSNSISNISLKEQNIFSSPKFHLQLVSINLSQETKNSYFFKQFNCNFPSYILFIENKKCSKLWQFFKSFLLKDIIYNLWICQLFLIKSSNYNISYWKIVPICNLKSKLFVKNNISQFWWKLILVFNTLSGWKYEIDPDGASHSLRTLDGEQSINSDTPY